VAVATVWEQTLGFKLAAGVQVQEPQVLEEEMLQSLAQLAAQVAAQQVAVAQE
jgi:hypothetical protein